MAIEQNASVPKERKQTDKSLRAERAKTDVALSAGKTKATDRAVDAVSASREKADEARSQARDNIDMLAGEIASQSEGAATEELLLKERSAADDVLECERRQMDSALEQERSEKRAVERDLFEDERQETDSNLTSERQNADLKARRSAEVLAEERDSHLATKAALTTRDEFLAIVSHDLRNPLGAISMVAELLTSSPTYGAFTGETREYIELIGRNADEALRLIGDLLDMERIAAGKLGLQIENLDIGQIIQHTVETFKLKASAKGVILEASGSEAEIFVKCDRVRISQVLSNLISNAIKFTPTGGKVALDFRSDRGNVQISVSDTGPGIPSAMLETIFERFWQIGKRDRSGLGLGLYISKMLLEAQQGRIWVESELGKGSTFHVMLPAAGFVTA